MAGIITKVTHIHPNLTAEERKEKEQEFAEALISCYRSLEKKKEIEELKKLKEE